ncbi:hypothetical protein BG015_000654 [Linnemannia schmuckeri]|uniref:SH3 domain-containing protein n=1 Tax=Linnemannia schmuckeri TaxID=64567 RepID=A0A9P5RQT9_9FUNG|nr:hypothetical protein BG015_000654 [Linnemannia schmuckeri]
MVVASPARVPLSITNRKDTQSPTVLHTMVPPPVDFALLGQMAVLGDFDALTPVITTGQQNTFESNTFSILELTKVPSATATGGRGTGKILSVPVLLGSFAIDPPLQPPTPGSPVSRTATAGITATCVLDDAPHQIYIAGNFKQIPTTITMINNSTNSNSPIPANTFPSSGLNYVGMYDSRLKRFLPMENGLDGPVQDLLCDSITKQVYVVGQFMGPLQLESLSEIGSSNSSGYQILSSFGGGAAVWKRRSDVPIESDSSSSMESSSVATRASGNWAALPFKGVNGIVTSVTKAQDGTFYFGGQFDTTTDGEAYSAPDTQPVNLDIAKVMTGNGLNAEQDRNIICQPSTAAHGNWVMRDNIPGYWRVLFPYYITPTLFRLWNVDTNQGPEFANRGTKTFSILALPSNQFLNLSYIDPITHLQQYCTVCTLESRSVAATVHQGYQDFLVVTPTLLNAAQIDIVSWEGLGGGLGGVEVYQSEIFVRAVDELNFSSKCASNYAEAAALNASGTNHKDNKDRTAYSSFLGADWVTTKMEGGWQTVQVANVSATDAASRQQAYVDMSPYLQESGLYDVYFYTPACSGGSSSGATGSKPSNACTDRGFVDVSMYFGSSDNVITLTLSQTNTADKYDKIYSGMISHTTPDFRPHVVVRPSAAKTGTSGGGATQTVIVDSIQFVKQATLNNTNSLIFYRPSTSVVTSDFEKDSKDTIQGLDDSTWGNLPTQIPSGSLVNALVSYFGPFGSSATPTSMLFIAGAFQGTTYSNIVGWDGSNYQDLGGGGSSSGLDGIVSGMALYQSSLYVVGSFHRALTTSTAAVSDFGGLAIYDIVSQTWTPFGNATQTFQPNAQFRSIELSTGPNGQFQFIIAGQFSWTGGENRTETSAVWDLDNQRWVRGQQKSADNEFQFGYVQGEISYLNRVLGSSSNTASEGSSSSSPVLLVAGMIDSLDTYQVGSPENVAWLTTSGVLKTTNLSPAILTSSPAPGFASDDVSGATSASTATTSLSQTNAGIMYYNPTAGAWVTLVGGAHADGSIGAGYFNSPTASNPVLTFKQLNLAAASSSPITGEVLALGLQKEEQSGFTAKGSGSDLLLLGGSFKSASSPGISSLLIYDLYTDQPIAATPALRGFSNRGNPIVNVIKSRPGHKSGALVIAGDFSGVGNEVSCELICVWDPAQARTAIDKKKSLEGSFRNVYGDGTGSKKHMGVLKGVVNDITFEDDKNMFVAGDLIVNGVACGVASFNFDHGKWTTFGSILDSPKSSSSPSAATTRSPGPDTLPGPVSAIAHDSLFHRFFVAGRSVTDGSAYFKKWNGQRFVRVSSDFMPTSEIHRIEILPASKDAPNRSATVSSSSAAPIQPTASSPTDDDHNDPPSNPNDTATTTPPSSSSPPLATASAAASGNIIDPNDTTNILEQGYILLISGKIVLGNPSSSYSLSASGSAATMGSMSATSSRQESSSLAFFDGQSWFPFLQSSRNASISVSPSSFVADATTASVSPQLTARDLLHLSQQHPGDLSHFLAKRADLTSSPTIPPTPLQGHIRVRDQGIFRALAIAHLPRIIAREYLSVPLVILISIAISLALITLIVLFGFLYIWLKRRLSKDDSAAAATRPRLGSSFMEDGYDGYLHRTGGPRGGLYSADSSLGPSQGAAFVEGSTTAMAPKKSGSFFRRSKSEKNNEPESSQALMESLGITSALESARVYRAQRKNSTGAVNALAGRPTMREKPGTVGTFAGMSVAGGGGGGVGGGSGSQNGSEGSNSTGTMVYRPNSTIQEATGAMVTEFVRSHEQQRSATADASVGAGDAPLDDEEDMPPSPDRRSKKSRQSGLYPPGTVRDSTASDLTNPTPSRYASLLSAHNISSPGGTGAMATTPTSPATAMTTPSDAIHSAHPSYLHNSTRDSTTSTSNRTSTPFGNNLPGGNVIYYARYPFRAREIGELGFKAGERILVVDMSDDVWWMGVVQDPVTGQQMHGFLDATIPKLKVDIAKGTVFTMMS